MCLTPIRLKTSSIYRRSNGYSKYYIEVPCCQCAECLQQKKNDWYIRNYFEAQDLFKDSDSYMMLITLSYDDEHLPNIFKTLVGVNLDEDWPIVLKHLDKFMKDNNMDSMSYLDAIKIFSKKNFSCFNYHDVQNFLKLLRIRLERAGYNVKGNLRYFLAAEYGHDEVYVDDRGRIRKGTNRPHYHFVPYVNGELYRQGLTPEKLSLYVSTLWINGRTDGLPYKDLGYVRNHSTFGPNYVHDPVRLRKVHYYVTKYVCKDYEFHDTIDSRISYILTQLYKISYDSSTYKDKKRELHRYMDQFHRQSVGFGYKGLLSDVNVLDSIMSEGKIKMPDEKFVYKYFSIPSYYVRKLFQKCEKDSEGRPHWVWNDLGIEWRRRRIFNSIDVLATKMEDWLSNIDSYTDISCNYRQKVLDILDGRSFRDYAEYIICYKGRFCENPLSPDSIDVIINNSLLNPISSDSFIKVSDDLYSYKGQFYTNSSLDQFVMSDNCLGDRFKNFDLLYDLYHIVMISYNLKKQELYEQKLQRKKVYSALGIKTKKNI